MRRRTRQFDKRPALRRERPTPARRSPGEDVIVPGRDDEAQTQSEEVLKRGRVRERIGAFEAEDRGDRGRRVAEGAGDIVAPARDDHASLGRAGPALERRDCVAGHGRPIPVGIVRGDGEDGEDLRAVTCGEQAREVQVPLGVAVYEVERALIGVHNGVAVRVEEAVHPGQASIAGRGTTPIPGRSGR